MRFLWSSAVKDLKRRLRDPWALLLWLGIPIVIGGMMNLAFGGRGGSPPKAHLLVADRDGSFLSHLFVNALSRTPVIETEAADSAAGRARVEAGGATALLVIPPGFGDAILDERPVTLSLLTNPAQRILPGITEETLHVLVDVAFYAQRLVGGELREIRAGVTGGAGFTDPQIAAVSVSFNHVAKRLAKYLFPPIVRLESRLGSPQPAEGSGLGLGLLMFPGILFMGLLFVAQGISSDLWDERLQGTLRRVLASPHGVTLFLAGKLLAGAMVIGGVCAGAILFGALVFDLDRARLPAALVWSVFAGSAFLSFLMLLQLFASSQRTAGMLSTMVIFPLLMVGGSFFPFEAMPAWLARIGRLTPNGWALEQLKAILWGNAEAASVLVAIAGLTVVTAASLLLGAYRLRRGFAVP